MESKTEKVKEKAEKLTDQELEGVSGGLRKSENDTPTNPNDCEATIKLTDIHLTSFR